jgi:hypothetical protein
MRPKVRSRGQRLQIVSKQLAARGIALRVWRVPADCPQQLRSRFVNVVLPGREHTDVAPLSDGIANRGSSLENHRLYATRNRVSGRGKADRARAYDCDGLWFHHCLTFSAGDNPSVPRRPILKKNAPMPARSSSKWERLAWRELRSLARQHSSSR